MVTLYINAEPSHPVKRWQWSLCHINGVKSDSKRSHVNLQSLCKFSTMSGIRANAAAAKDIAISIRDTFCD